MLRHLQLSALPQTPSSPAGLQRRLTRSAPRPAQRPPKEELDGKTPAAVRSLTPPASPCSKPGGALAPGVGVGVGEDEEGGRRPSQRGEAMRACGDLRVRGPRNERW